MKLETVTAEYIEDLLMWPLNLRHALLAPYKVEVDVESAKARRPKDKAKILEMIQNEGHGIHKTNKEVANAIASNLKESAFFVRLVSVVLYVYMVGGLVLTVVTPLNEVPNLFGWDDAPQISKCLSVLNPIYIALIVGTILLYGRPNVALLMILMVWQFQVSWGPLIIAWVCASCKPQQAEEWLHALLDVVMPSCCFALCVWFAREIPAFIKLETTERRRKGASILATIMVYPLGLICLFATALAHEEWFMPWECPNSDGKVSFAIVNQFYTWKTRCVHPWPYEAPFCDMNLYWQRRWLCSKASCD